jgi:hypothetical protein
MAVRTIPCTVVDSFLGRALGLMFSGRPRPLALAFPSERRIGLHMGFVFFPIDVAFLDRNRRVVELLEGFRPWTAYTSRKPAMYALEMPAGWARGKRLRTGDAVRFA